MKELENTLQDLKCMLIEDGYKDDNIVMRTLIKAQQQVKNLNIPVVMQRSEQLFAFLEYCDSAGWIKNVDKKRIIEDYEKANNCA